MTRAMVVQVTILGVSLVAAGVLARLVWKSLRKDTKPLTVEQEQAQSREVVNSTAQWEWRGLNDAECESSDDPVFALVHELSKAQT